MAKQKRKVSMPAGIRNKMIAATSMLMVSCIMMVSSTYAWFTLSTAPEVKNISTTVAGNGSLEIALMPPDGMLGSIGTGFSSTANGGSVDLVEANKTWGNVVYLNDSSYGLNYMALNPAILNTTETDGTISVNTSNPMTIAEYGYDGRIVATNATKTTWKSYVENAEAGEKGGFSGNQYGVRVIGNAKDDTLGDTYGYIVDMAFRLNSTSASGQAGSLLLQTNPLQRIYTESVNEDTKGSGSCMTFDLKGSGVDVEKLMSAVRVTFVQDYGNIGQGNTPKVLGTAKLDVKNITKSVVDGAEKHTAKLYLYETVSGSTTVEGTTTTVTNEEKVSQENAVLIPEMQKNQSVQVSAIVWLDGASVTNSSVAAVKINETLATSTLNLQFSTNIPLNPADNNKLMSSTTE